MLQITDLVPSRPPCSLAERDAAAAVHRQLHRLALRPAFERTRAPTSPTWVPLLRALLRVWGAAFLAAGWPAATIGLGAASIVAGIPQIAGLIRFIPLLGAPAHNVVAARRGAIAESRPIVVVAHLDSHPTAGAPLSRAHVFVAAASGWLTLAVGIAARPGGVGWRWAAALVAGEAVVSLVWLARQELSTPGEPPDDNTSGLIAIVRAAMLVADGTQTHDVWFVATAAGTSGSYGMTSFLKQHRDARRGWVIDVDALGSGEVIASPFPPIFPNPGTPSSLVRAVVEAARVTGDPLTVRRVRRPHSDARAALRMRVPAIALTGGLHPPAGGPGPDPGNAERAALIVEALARSAD